MPRQQNTHTLQIVDLQSMPACLDRVDCFVQVGSATLYFTMHQTNDGHWQPGCAGQPVFLDASNNNISIALCKPSGKRIGSAVFCNNGHQAPIWVPLQGADEGNTCASICLHIVPLSPETTSSSNSAQETPMPTTPTPDELQAAIQLQQWRMAQEQAYTKQLDVQTKQHMAQLDTAWAQRVAALEAEWSQRQRSAEEARARYQALEQVAGSLLEQLQQREARVAEAEATLHTAVLELETQAARVAHDAAQRVQQVEHACAVQVEQARAEGVLAVQRAEGRCAALEATCAQLKQQLQEATSHVVVQQQPAGTQQQKAIQALHAQLADTQTRLQQQAAALQAAESSSNAHKQHVEQLQAQVVTLQATLHKQARNAAVQGLRHGIAALKQRSAAWGELQRLVLERADLLEVYGNVHAAIIVQLDQAILDLVLQRLCGKPRESGVASDAD